MGYQYLFICKIVFMKKSLLFIALFIGFMVSLQAQTLVSMEVQKKNVVLEEFTGIHCQYCPEGHAIAQALQNENPGDVVLINIHQGSFAIPSGSEPDFRTPFGDAIANQTGLTGYPSGTINRHVFPDLASVTALSRGAWTTAAGLILEENSPVNVGASTSYDEATRELTVNVELYYTSDSPEGSNFIQVALLQSGIVGPQTGGGMGNNYIHNHMLRYLITDQWGEEITTTTAGSFVQKTYVYTIPDNFTDVPCIVEDCQVAVFVTESHQEVYSGVEVNAIDGTTLLTAALSSPEEFVLIGESGSTSTFELNITNLLPAADDFELTLTNENQPAGWNSAFVVDGMAYDETAIVNIDPGNPKDFSIEVTPDAASAVVKYTFSAQSLTHPNAPIVMMSVYVMSEVNDLLVNNQGAWTNGDPASFQQDYFDAFDYANMQKYTACDYSAFKMLGAEQKLNNVYNIYFNIGWTFPSFTDENVGYLATFLDAGGNLFVAGQDIGWDTWENDGNGTAITRAFYTDYLSADYKADGSTANNSASAYPGEEIFGTMTSFSITDVYGGNMYPDQISPLGEGISIFKYNDSDTKSAAVRVTNGVYKVVYLGFDPSMIPADDRNEIIKRTEDWFNVSVGVGESKGYDVQLYPNPASDMVTIDAPNSQIQIYNSIGVLLMEVQTADDLTRIDISDFNPGSYFVRVSKSDKNLVKTLIVY
jgi:hypothetical protein